MLPQLLLLAHAPVDLCILIARHLVVLTARDFTVCTSHNIVFLFVCLFFRGGVGAGWYCFKYVEKTEINTKLKARLNLHWTLFFFFFTTYSEIPLLRPPKIKTFFVLKTWFAEFKLLFSSFSRYSVPLIGDHLWDCPKVVFKTTFGQSQRWS